MRVKTAYWRRTATILLIAASCCLGAQTQPQTQAASSIQDYFRRLVDNPSVRPKQQDLLKVQNQILKVPREDAASALPAIIEALTHRNDEVKIDAAAALFAVSRRSDSADLLTQYVGTIADLFNSPDARLQGTPSLIFVNLKPTPPPEVVPLLIAYLRRTDSEAKAQPGAILALAKMAGDQPEVASAIRGFLVRPLESHVRIDGLNALGDSRVRDPNVIGMVATFLEDPDKGIRFTAAQTLRRMGSNAVLQAEPALRKVAENPNEAADVRTAAKQALAIIPGHVD